MVLAGQLAVRRLNLGGLRRLGDPQGLVVVLLEVVLRAHFWSPLAAGPPPRRGGAGLAARGGGPWSLRSSVQAAPRPVGSLRPGWLAGTAAVTFPFSSLIPP